MKLFKSWVYRIVGGIFLVWGILSIISDVMDFDFIATGAVSGTLIMMVGGFLFAKGSMVADEPPES